MVGPLFDDWVERIEVVGEAGGCRGRRDVTSIDVDPVGDLVPDGGVTEPALNGVPRGWHDTPLFVAEVILLLNNFNSKRNF